jgi:ABC-type lipoprotein release transport system permease subunit
MITLAIAWRNLWRHPRRTALTAAAIALAVTVLTFFFSVQVKSYDMAINASTGIFHGHFQIQRSGYLNNPEMRKIIPNVWSLRKEIQEKVPGLLGVSIRAIGFGLISSKDRSYGSQIVGVEPLTEGDVSSIPGVIVEGEYFKTDSALGLVVGEVLARNLRIKLGDELTLISQGYDGGSVALALPVTGIFKSGSIDIDRGMVQIPLVLFQEYFGMSDSAHTVILRVLDRSKLEETQARLDEIVSSQNNDLVAVDWKKLMPGLNESIELDMSAGWFFYIALIAVVSFTILNTFLMAVLERTKEFGIILAVGARSSSLTKLVLIEGFFLTLLGLLMGFIFGALVVSYFGHVGFTAPGAEEVLKKWNLPGRIYPEVTFKSFYPPLLTVMVASLLSVFYPAFRAFKMEALKALQGGR